MRIKWLEEYNRWVTSDGQLFRPVKDGLALCPQRKKKGGYMHVNVLGNRQALVHRIVAEAFLPNLEDKPTVDHINRNRTDNRVENLRWATYQEQQYNTSVNQERLTRIGCLPSTVGSAEYERTRYQKDAEFRNRKIEASRRQCDKHKALGEFYHKCPDGHRRWHTRGNCPVCKLS